ncbi:MAG: GAF domain-containing protein, partial [Candidatus Omnitrophica bacterium]|nr:GAF domain-containing protein [Candidatus Omnitrophota bacterium]
MGFESQSEAEIRTLLRLTEQINKGITLEDALNHLFDSFRDVIPFDRISLATIENQGALVRSYWVRTDYPTIKINSGYAAKLNGSSLQRIILTNEPRIINDLETYLQNHPRSESTRRIIEEGVRSSLTCPLIAQAKPVGLLFFSSRQPHAYAAVHVQLFEAIAGHVASILEKARLYDQLLELNDIKNKFMGIVAHDLKTPLGVIKSHLDLLDQGLLGVVNPRQQESVSLMRDWCGRMLALITNLLSMSVVESGKLELHKTPTNITEFLNKEYPFYKLLA